MNKRIYQKPSEEDLRKNLSPLEYEVTQRAATEPPFRNRYWNHHGAGLYVDAASGEPLFSSLDKFDSGSGWPSFTRAIEPERVVSRHDLSHGMQRTEVRSRGADSHLGHLFEDGPAPTGMRYCINSAALRFVPVDQLEAEGYGEYRPLFEPKQASKPAAASKVPAAKSSEPSMTYSKSSSLAPSTSSNACSAQPSSSPEQPGCQATLQTAIVAGGCFWGMQELLRQIPGVLETEVGYTGGTSKAPTYDDVKTGKTNHAEAVRIVFDPSRLPYEDLLEKWFFRMHDPTTPNQQGNDIGTQYRSAIFVIDEAQRVAAERVKTKVQESGRWRAPLTTQIIPAGTFTRAEEYHQKYLQKHPGGYSCHFLRD